ncbi:MAG TPA: AMP-binding protein [Pseudonocardia sp.]|nr:AMP-binding protein [Pseudonocardia sp.]
MTRLVVGDLPRVNAERDPAGVAYVHGDRSWTWARIESRVNGLAHVLRGELGLGTGDVVGILADNRPEHLELMFAASRAKAIHTALKTRSHVAEMLRQFDDAPMRALVVGPGFEKQAAELAEQRDVRLVGLEGTAIGDSYESLIAGAPAEEIPSHQDPEAVYSIMYTSGSTGEPKGVAVASRNELAFSWSIAWSVEADPDDVYIDVLPLVHRGGQYIAMCAALFGRPTVIGVPDPAAMLAAIARHRVTVAILVPTIAKMMVDLLDRDPGSHDISSLRHFLVGSSAVPPELVKRILAAFPAAGISQIGGSSEGAATLCLTAEDYREIARNPAVEHRAASVGRPAPGVRVRLVDGCDNVLGDDRVGELVYQADAFIEAYWNKPELTKATWRGGWFHSGDLAYRDADGYYYYKDRLFGRIKTGAETVFSREVENVLITHADVAEVAVVGVPDEHWGEAVAAVVVTTRPTATEAERSEFAEELADLVRGALARFKVPKQFVFTTGLPKTALMKVPYGEVKQAVIDGSLPAAASVSTMSTGRDG